MQAERVELAMMELKELVKEIIEQETMEKEAIASGKRRLLRNRKTIERVSLLQLSTPLRLLISLLISLCPLPDLLLNLLIL